MVNVYLAEGFEEIEALTVVDLLRRAQIDVQLVSMTGELDVGGAHRIHVMADTLFENVDHETCKMMVLPGGMPGAENLENHEALCAEIKKFAAGEKFVAAICAAPMVLGSCGILEGRAATIYPGMEDRLVGATRRHMPVVRDENIITGRAPGAAMKFALELISALKDNVSAKEVEVGLCMA